MPDNVTPAPDPAAVRAAIGALDEAVGRMTPGEWAAKPVRYDHLRTCAFMVWTRTPEFLNTDDMTDEEYLAVEARLCDCDRSRVINGAWLDGPESVGEYDGMGYTDADAAGIAAFRNAADALLAVANAAVRLRGGGLLPADGEDEDEKSWWAFADESSLICTGCGAWDAFYCEADIKHAPDCPALALDAALAALAAAVPAAERGGGG